MDCRPCHALFFESVYRRMLLFNDNFLYDGSAVNDSLNNVSAVSRSLNLSCVQSLSDFLAEEVVNFDRSCSFAYADNVSVNADFSVVDSCDLRYAAVTFFSDFVNAHTIVALVSQQVES